MPNRRPFNLLVSFAVLGVVGLVVAAVFDEQKGWNHPGQAVANVAWIVMMLCLVGLVLSGATLLTQRLRKNDTVR